MSANPYYDYSGNFIAGVLARAEVVAAEFQGVQQGFNLLSNQGVDSGGAANVYNITTPYAPQPPYTDGQTVRFKVTHVNTGGSTITVNGGSVVSLLRFNGTALAANDLILGVWYVATYSIVFGAWCVIEPAAYVLSPSALTAGNNIALTPSGGNVAVGMSYPQTALESAASVVPPDLQFYPGYLERYGAIGDGVTNDTTAVTTAESIAQPTVTTFSRVYKTTIANGGSLTGVFIGAGQILTNDGNKRAPWFSPLSAAPSSIGNFTSVDTMFNGDLSHVLIAAEHRVTGATTLTQPATGYVIQSETATFVSGLYIGSTAGYQQGTGASDNGRTAVADTIKVVEHYGNGDAMAFWVDAFCAGTRAGSTSWLGNPATTLFGGQNFAGANGVYLQGIGDIDLNDNGVYDVMAVGMNINLNRTVTTGALNTDWLGYRVQSQNAVVGAYFSGTGSATIGLHLCGGSFGAGQAAIALGQSQRIYFNAAQGGSFNLPRDVTLHTDWLERSSSGFFNFVYNNTSCLQISSTQITAVVHSLFQPGSGTAITANGVANTSTVLINGSSTSGQSFGLTITAGTTSADAAVLIENQAATVTFLEIFGDGHGTIGPNTTNNLSWTSGGDFTLAAPTAGTALFVNAVASGYALVLLGSATAGASLGALIKGGTNSGDNALLVQNQAGTVAYLQLFGDGHGSIGPSSSLGLSWNTAGGVNIAAPSSGAALIVSGVANSYTVSITGSSTSGQSLGEIIKAGTTSADIAFVVQNQAGSLTFFEIFGDGHGTLGASSSLGAAWATTGELGISTPSTIGSLPGGFTQVGYMDTPQNHITANYTLALTDRGKSIYITGTTASQQVTIPANGSVAFPVTTTIIIINLSNQSWTVGITTDTLEWLPGGATGTRTLAAGGMMSLYKDTATHWLAWGFSIT